MDAMAYLKLALTDDDKAFERVLNKPKRGLGGGTLEKLRQTQGRFKCSLLQAAKRASRTEVKGHLSTAQQKGTQAFLKIISDLRRDVEEKSAVDVMRSMVRRIYSEAAGSKSKKGKDDDEFLMAKIVTEFISDLLMAQGLDDDQATVRAGGASAELGRTVRELSTFINAVAELDTEGLKRMRESEVLTLTTIHQAKGLEWSHVWVVHMAEGICPLKRNMDCDDDQAMEQQRDEFLQEERRLAYVAITRAKEVLHMSWVCFLLSPSLPIPFLPLLPRLFPCSPCYLLFMLRA
jgi:superfamily I DNA/RNA helicase